ncbi:Cobalamin synthase [Candidatus Johnevansia muelleri]|uniref:Adenosylcobinamide-GDP ribazoletransferase n=1 Tax=Candidatus Johnevansia muelleri TaxID=1495769 RepID=A0A078KI25_9GAMM|nr:Cobalamin synthase [Candidatus Evansia muelleri]
MFFLKQLRLIILAISFITCLDMSYFIFNVSEIKNCRKYFGLIGLLIGIFSSIIYIIIYFFPCYIAIFFSLISTIILTGALHEDGLADSIDAIMGGWGVKNKLNIMKDSRIGTYGTLALIISLLFKIILIFYLSLNNRLLSLIYIFIIANSLSRIIPTLFMDILPYIFFKNSKIYYLSMPLSLSDKIIILIPNIFLYIFFIGIIKTISLLFILFIIFIYFIKFIKYNLGGYTGDILGTIQQISEIFIYIIFNIYA